MPNTCDYRKESIFHHTWQYDVEMVRQKGCRTISFARLIKEIAETILFSFFILLICFKIWFDIVEMSNLVTNSRVVWDVSTSTFRFKIIIIYLGFRLSMWFIFNIKITRTEFLKFSMYYAFISHHLHQTHRWYFCLRYIDEMVDLWIIQNVLDIAHYSLQSY